METEEILIVKRHSEDTNPLKWEFPGGGLDNEKPKSAVERELYEETGLRPVKTMKKKEEEVDIGGRLFRFHVFLVEVDSRDVELSEEHIDFKWIDINETENFNTVDGFKKDLEVIKNERR